MGNSSIVSVIILGAVFSFTGCVEKSVPECSDKSVQQSKIVTDSAVPIVQEAYDATLEEGIDFKKRGYPNFLAKVSGISGYEPSGRWSEVAAGPAAKFQFREALPRKFILEIAAEAFGPNAGVPITVKVGDVIETFTIKPFVSNKGFETYRLVFETNGSADTVEIVPPKPTSPSELDKKNGDTRKLGIFFHSLRILK